MEQPQPKPTWTPIRVQEYHLCYQTKVSKLVPFPLYGTAGERQRRISLAGRRSTGPSPRHHIIREDHTLARCATTQESFSFLPLSYHNEPIMASN